MENALNGKYVGLLYWNENIQLEGDLGSCPCCSFLCFRLLY